VLRRVGHVEGIDDFGRAGDKLWPLRLAGVGDLIRVPEVLYFKRDHADSVSHKGDRKHANGPREAWLRVGRAIYAEAEPYFAEPDRQELAIAIADRLVMRRPGRMRRYDAVAALEPAPFVMEFFSALEAQWGVEPPLSDEDDGSGDGLQALRAQRDHTTEGTVLRLVADGLLVEAERRALVAEAREAGVVRLDCSAGGQAAVALLEGWSRAETWGAWSDGLKASMWLPLPADGQRWRVQLVGKPYQGTSTASADRRLVVAQGEDVLLDCQLTTDRAIPAFDLSADTAAGDGIILRLDMPDATSPAELGLSPDRRKLTLALSRIELTRTAAPR
jgi:hypothetical protein